MGKIWWVHFCDCPFYTWNTLESTGKPCHGAGEKVTITALILSLNVLFGTLLFLPLPCHLYEQWVFVKWGFLDVTLCNVQQFLLTSENFGIIFLNAQNQKWKARITEKFLALTKYYSGEKESSYFLLWGSHQTCVLHYLSLNISLTVFACVKQSGTNLACSLLMLNNENHSRIRKFVLDFRLQIISLASFLFIFFKFV